MSGSKADMRRMLLRASALLPILLISPTARTEPVTTSVAVAKIATAVMAGLQALAQSRNDLALRTNVEAVLAGVQAIIAQQETIIKELRDIQKLIVENSLQAWKDAYSRDIGALAASLRVNVADLNSNRGRMTSVLSNNFGTIEHECSQVTIKAGEMDPFTFVFYVTGVGVVFICDHLLKSSSARTQGWRKEFVKPLDRWLDDKLPSSMPGIIAQTSSEIKIRKAKLAAVPPEYIIGTHTSSPYDTDGTGDETCRAHYDDFVTIKGDYISGFSGVKASRYRDRTCRTRSPGIHRMLVSVDEIAPVPVSEFEYINSLNAERAAIRKLEVAEEDQRALLSQMQQFRKLLTG